MSSEADFQCDGFAFSPPKCMCDAPFKADADIAGPGVLAAFLATAWITCFVAAVSAWYDIQETWEENAGISKPAIIDVVIAEDASNNVKAARTNPRPKVASRNLLLLLCDLQLMTGTAIIIAGLGQLPEISYYHEALIVQYWQLTLNSFWAARASHRHPTSPRSHSIALVPLNPTTPQTDRLPPPPQAVVAKPSRFVKTEDDTRKPSETLRTSTILVSVTLSFAFQIIAVLRENYTWYGQEWDISASGRCYRSNDQTGIANSWLWIAGLLVYAVFLLLELRESSRVMVRIFGEGLIRWLDLVRRNERWKSGNEEMFRPLLETAHERPLLAVLGTICWCIAEIIRLSLKVIVFLVLQFVAVWSFGSGGYGVEVLVYIAFAIWSSFDIIDLKLMNKTLVVGEESSWGFGQILPMVLLAALGFGLVDILEKMEVKEG